MSFLVNDANAVDGRSLLDDGPSIWDATLVLQPDHTLLSDSSAALLVPVVASEDYSSSCFVAMNRFEVKEDSKSLFEERWSQRQSKLPHQPGFLGFSLLRKAATERRTPTTTQRRRRHDPQQEHEHDRFNYSTCTIWDSIDFWEQWRNGGGKTSHGHEASRGDAGEKPRRVPVSEWLEGPTSRTIIINNISSTVVGNKIQTIQNQSSKVEYSLKP
jgi:heme-degrading monooxygenase HmoA